MSEEKVSAPISKLVRMSPFYAHLISRLITLTHLKTKSQVVFAALTTIYDAAVRSKSERIVLRSDLHQRQQSVSILQGCTEERLDSEENRGCKLTTLRLNLPTDINARLKWLVEFGFAPNDSAAIRRCIFLLDHIMQYIALGWELGWIGSDGKFCAIQVKGSQFKSAPAICTEDTDEYQETRNYMLADIENQLPEILAKARYTGKPAKEVANDFLRGGYHAITQVRVFESCEGNIDRCTALLCDLATGYSAARKPSLVVSIRVMADIVRFFKRPILSYISQGIAVYLLHFDFDEMRQLAKDLLADTTKSEALATYCHFVEVEEDFFEKKAETVVCNFESPLMRCGIKWFSSGGLDRRFEPLSDENLDHFFDQIEPRIRSAGTKLCDIFESPSEQWII